MTAVVGPIMGPVLGGYICEHFSWPWLFLANVPITLGAALVTWRFLVPRDPPQQRCRVDAVGFGLLVLWIGSLQVVLDKGHELDWMDSNLIVTAAILAAVGFVAFIIWELTDSEPIVDLRVFRHSGFTIMTVLLYVNFVAFFGQHLMLGLWLQTNMGYTASWAGFALAPGGIAMFCLSPFVVWLTNRVDLRTLYSIGMIGFTGVLWTQAHFTPTVTYEFILATQLCTGVCVALFFAPSMSLAMSFVEPKEITQAAGLLSFTRTMSTAITTAISILMWNTWSTEHRTGFADRIDGETALSQISHAGLPPDQILGYLDRIVDNQAVMSATNDVFTIYAACMAIGAFGIWLVPQPRRESALAH